jgi:electron transfer flavoprotein alpha subunit
MVIIYAETWENEFKKTTFEAISYGSKCAQKMGVESIAVVFGDSVNPIEELGEYGIDKVIHVQEIDEFEPYSIATALSSLFKELNGKLLVLNGTANGKSLIGILSSLINAAAISNVTSFPINHNPLTVLRSAFSSKGIEQVSSNSDCTILSLVPNALGIISDGDSNPSVVLKKIDSDGKTSILQSEKESGEIPLPEAERVVSAGRGLKGPENWNIITDLAKVLNAGTACSKPVSDIGWRPHSEHVGQTGIQINPELYIAIGISGAIQHLAGVSRSKTIVVINNDPEAPFFKAADYGIVGDAFDVVPRLTETLKSFKK